MHSLPNAAAGFKKLVKDANLELKVYDMEQMSRLFMIKGGAKVGCQQHALRALQNESRCCDPPSGISAALR